MHFAAPFPLWLAVLATAGVAAVVALAYRRPPVPLTPARRALLATLRALSLAALLLFLARPTIVVPPGGSQDLVVPVLVDVSRSMRVPDAEGGRTRMASAVARLTRDVIPALSRRFKTEVYTFGESLAPASVESLGPVAATGGSARHSDLSGALSAAAERYRGRRVAGLVVVTDGVDTGGETGPRASMRGGSAAEGGRRGGTSTDGAALPPIYAIGIGSPQGPPDREIVGVTAADPRLDAATVDLKVSAVSRGFGREPFQVRVLTGGRVVETRRLTPLADGSPIDALFTVLPDATTASVFTVEIVAEAAEAIPENNQRSVLISPAVRKRRVLALEGAPGFDHSFLARALTADPGLELDTVVRKGKNDTGQDTFFVQAGGGRAPSLTTGFPASREALFAYDAVIVANLESDFFARAQLQLLADFVAERGGGLLVLGGKAFSQRGLIGTPLEEALPLELNDRRGGLARAAFDRDAVPRRNAVTLTTDGAAHPVMRLGPSPADSVRLWAALPELASTAQLGGPRPGAQVLAVTATAGGAVVPLVAVQRYGRGRSMIFAGEGSWRWRMMLPATDRSHEFFWRQAARWISGEAAGPVAVVPPENAEVGDRLTLALDVRDPAFAPVPDATVTATLTVPGGEARPVVLKRDAGPGGRFEGAVQAERPGLYRLEADARRGSTPLGAADGWFYVGGSDREFADPRLNDGVLRRIAAATGGRYVDGGQAADAGQLASWLESSAPAAAEPARRDLWHEPWAFALLVGLLSVEWVLRRRWGLR